jgi:hypothetical protein
MARRKPQPKDDAVISLDDFTELVILAGLDGARMILKEVQAGTKADAMKPLIDFVVKRQASRPKREREEHERRAREFAAKVRAMKEAGEL